MSNSPLATYTRITKNKTSPRNHAIDTITIHCIVGQWTAKQGCDYSPPQTGNVPPTMLLVRMVPLAFPWMKGSFLVFQQRHQ